MWNPLYDRWEAEVGHEPEGPFGYRSFSIERFRAREEMIETYAFSVPTHDVLKTIVQHAPRIVELGAATGYWAKVLSDCGADVVAYDHVKPGTKNTYFHGQEIARWFPVRHGDIDTLSAHEDRALLLSWPPMDDTAARAVEAWRGGILVYVGESQGGCTADDAFFGRLEADFEEMECLALPQWPGLHDYVYIHHRRGYVPKTRRVLVLDESS